MTSSFLLSIQRLYREKTVELSIAVSVAGIFLLVSFLAVINFLSYRDDAQIQIIDPVESLEARDLVEKTLESCCTVEVAGAVNNPGVYQVAPESRVQEAIMLAGGFQATADTDFIAQKINLAKKIDDQEKIYIPFHQKTTPGTGVTLEETISGKTSVNSATQKQLEDLPVIGEKTAEKIISLRPFSSIDDFFTKVKISIKQQEELRELLSL